VTAGFEQVDTLLERWVYERSEAAAELWPIVEQLAEREVEPCGYEALSGLAAALRGDDGGVCAQVNQ
jgi:hypothetical protein